MVSFAFVRDETPSRHILMEMKHSQQLDLTFMLVVEVCYWRLWCCWSRPTSSNMQL